VLSPAFGPARIRELSGIFLDKANEMRTPPPHVHAWMMRRQLREFWLSNFDPATSAVRLMAVAGLSAATFDIIRPASLGYAFNALSRPTVTSKSSALRVRRSSGPRTRSRSRSTGHPSAGGKFLRAHRAKARPIRVIKNYISRELTEELKAAAA
jgi:hypothetical protein